MSNPDDGKPRIESENLSDFARIMDTGEAPANGGDCETPRINLSDGDGKNGLGRLVLVVVRLLHELLEKQAIRRMDAGSLSDDEIERLGLALMKQAGEIERLRKEFKLDEDELNIDLGPLGKLL